MKHGQTAGNILQERLLAARDCHLEMGWSVRENGGKSAQYRLDANAAIFSRNMEDAIN